MRLARLTALAMGLVVAALPASAQVSFDLKAAWTQQTPYSFSSQSVFAEGAFFFTKDAPDASETNRALELVRSDALTGERTVVGASNENWANPLFVLPGHINTQRKNLMVFDRMTGKLLGSRLLADRVEDAMIDGETLYLLQWGKRPGYTSLSRLVLSRFNVNGMAFLGETPMPEIGGRPRFMNGDIVGIGRRNQCDDSKNCSALYRVGLNGTIRSSVALKAERRPQPLRACALVIHHIAADRIFVDAGCGTYLAIDGDVKRVVYSLPRGEIDLDYDIAVAGDLLLARPENALQYWSEKRTVQPVQVFDVATGVPIGAALLPPGQLRTAGGSVVLTDHARTGEMRTLVYAISTGG